jgi:hypothetical protein
MVVDSKAGTGKLLADRYKLAKELGDGTFGQVLLAYRVDTQEKVAIKRCVFRYLCPFLRTVCSPFE